MKQAEKTVNCHDRGPSECADELVRYLKSTHGVVKVAQIGFQPRMVESLATNFPLRVLDLDPDNIGAQKFRPVRLDFSNCGYGTYPVRGGLFSKGRKTLSHNMGPAACA